MKEKSDYKIIGNTCDDALGEAYDKVARMLGLPYPGGKIISDLAKKEKAKFPNKKPPYPLPRPMIHSKNLNFSFSGLKTAVLYADREVIKKNAKYKEAMCAEVQQAIIDVLIKKSQSELIGTVVKVALMVICGVGVVTTMLYAAAIFTSKDTQIIGSTWSNMFGILLTNAFSIVGTIMGVKYATEKK